MKFSTKAIHLAEGPDKQTGAITLPIYQTSTYQQVEPGVHRGFSYSRTENPTRKALEENLAVLEGGKYGVALASGLAAVNTVLNLLKTGDHIVATYDLYGGSYRIFTKVYNKYGLEFSFVDTTRLESIEQALQENTRLLWLETPSNPLLNITDIRAAVKIARKRGVLTVVDNTFATPYLQQPLELGVDIVVQSTTKYLGGHSDLIGGAVIVNDEDIYNQLKFYQNAVGAVPGPQDCFLVSRGIKTLAVRVERHCQNARKVAEFLKSHPQVNRVFYPGLDEHPGHAIARRQMKDFGGIVSFELKGGFEAAKTVATSVKIFTLAESLGTVCSLINHPATMTHASIPPEVRIKNGITDGLLRLSVGIEDIEDIISDLTQALSKVEGGEHYVKKD